MVQLVAGSNALRRFKTDAFFLSPNNVFLSCAVGCNLFEMNISYSFGNINAINLLCQQPSVHAVDHNLKSWDCDCGAYVLEMTFNIEDTGLLSPVMRQC